ncbi:MAG: hypothetical protein IT289_09365 [Oligoflexia bacterium]|nr:hypothetical protein [Oligoflexia bacterium]
MKFITAFICMLSIPVLGSQKAYDLSLALYLNGEQITSPHLILKEGQTAFLSIKDNKTKDETFLQVSAQEKDKGIFVMSKIGKMKHGKMEIISEPQIVALENEKAEIETSETNPKRQSVRLSVLVRKTSF